MNAIRFLPLALLAIAPGLRAQTIPGGGSQLQQLPTPPAAPATEPRIRIEEATATSPAGDSGARVEVRQLHFTDARIFTEDELRTIAGFVPGASLSLPELQAMALRITQHYRQRGYFVARAYLPAQDISNHEVTIAVREGRYGEVALHNHSQLADGVANQALSGIDSGDAITLAPLEHRLLLLSDIPGVRVTTTLAPGSAPGTSDLIVDVAPGPRFSGSLDVDNAGNPYTGENRLGASLNWNNPLGRGDVASLRAVTSGPGMRYGRLGYQMPVGPITAGIGYSRLEYELSAPFDLLGANGSADVASVFGSMPLLRSRDSNLSVGLSWEAKRFIDRLDAFPDASRKTGIGVATLSLYGNHRDDVGLGGNTTYYLGLSSGTVDIRTPTARADDAITARSNGDYRKLLFSLSRDQSLGERLSLRAWLIAQLASKNLDPSEKLGLGGMDAIRAYPQGEAFGDEGVLLGLEGRLLLASHVGNSSAQLHLLGLLDAGRVTVDKNPWFAGDNHRNLRSAGIGLELAAAGNYSVRMFYARKLGSGEATSAPDRSGRFWFQAVKYF